MDGRTPTRRPAPAVAAVIVDDGKLLLVKRGCEPSKGKWSIHGGSVEWGESLTDAVAREVREETGLEIQVGPLAGVYDLIVGDDGNIDFHYVILDYHARPIGGTLRAGDDAADARWFPLSDLDHLDLAEHLRDRLHQMGVV